MHPSAYTFGTSALTPAQVKDKRVVEVGAYNYNGSVRPHLESLGPASYLATDAQAGPGVDLVCAAENLPRTVGYDTADVVACFEMLEHALDWRGAVAGMAGTLAPGGLLLLTTRSAGFPFHPHPVDCWRYSLEQMEGICEACGLEVIRLEPDPDPASPGVFLLARKPAAGWDEAGMAEGLKVIEPGPPR